MKVFLCFPIPNIQKYPPCQTSWEGAEDFEEVIVDLKGRSRRSSQARRPKIAFQRFFGIFPGHLTLPGVSSSWRVATDLTPQKSQQRTTAWNQVPKNFSCEQVVAINQRSSHFLGPKPHWMISGLFCFHSHKPQLVA